MYAKRGAGVIRQDVPPTWLKNMAAGRRAFGRGDGLRRVRTFSMTKFRKTI